MKKLLISFLCCFGTILLSAQQRTCGSAIYLAEQLEENPDMARALDKQERLTEAYQSNQRENTVITIPVVFHVIHNGDAIGTGENISDAQILAQLDQMNADFALMNSDASMIPTMFAPLAANTMIQFCLAQRTPDCQATTGIVRYNFGQESWTRSEINTTVKPSTIWDRDNYLNVWTVRFGGVNSNLLGFAQFPGGTANTDGVVNAYFTTGSLASPFPGGSPYNKGRTMTHEVGYWLNLRHIWGDANCGNDLVADTPIHETDNNGCPTHPKTNTCSGTITEMFMNYMDYVNDDCMHMFSQGQSDRMYAVLDEGGLRASLVASEGCVAPGVCYCDAGAIDVANEKIGNVTFAGINQTSMSNAGYENFRLVMGTAEREATYAFSATITTPFVTDQILVWIDYNQDGDFEDAGELVFTSSTGAGPHTTNITIPATALLGETRMRVRLHDTTSGPNATPCGDSNFGQVEDYTLNITSALPVTWTSFNAQLKNQYDAYLTWSTADEVNNEGFTVEMAKKEATVFVPLGFVPANSTQQYQFYVEDMEAGQYLFRLRQQDYDGRTSYSAIKSLMVTREVSDFSLYPNPVNDYLVINLNTPAQETVEVTIYNETGQPLQNLSYPSTTSTIQLATHALPAGVYFLQLKTGAAVQQRRFVVN